jgi:hypothetical protein
VCEQASNTQKGHAHSITAAHVRCYNPLQLKKMVQNNKKNDPFNSSFAFENGMNLEYLSL